MGGILDFLRDWFRGPPPDASLPPARLTEADALRIAREAAAAAGHDRDAERLLLATRYLSNGKLAWSVTVPSRGHKLYVEVDDETGAVTWIGHRGLR